MFEWEKQISRIDALTPRRALLAGAGISVTGIGLLLALGNWPAICGASIFLLGSLFIGVSGDVIHIIRSENPSGTSAGEIEQEEQATASNPTFKPAVVREARFKLAKQMKRFRKVWAWMLGAVAIATLLAVMGIRSHQNRQKLKGHVAFMEGYVEFEKVQVGAFWRCLFGKDGDGRRFDSPDRLNATLESALFADPQTYPEKVTGDCVPIAFKAAEGVRDLSTLPEYREALDRYGKSVTAMASALQGWGEGVPKRVEVRLREQRVTTAGETWSTTANLDKADPVAWQYDQFLHCAVPDIDNFSDGKALLEFIASKCVRQNGKDIDVAFLNKLRDTCVPEAQQAPLKALTTFKATFNKYALDYDKLSQAFNSCFRKLLKQSPNNDDLTQFDNAWAEWISASSAVRKVAVSGLCDGGDDKACATADKPR